MKALNWLTEMKAEKGLADHVLVMLASATAVYSVGMSLNKPLLAYTLTFMVILASMAGYGLSRLVAGTFLQNWDAGLWTFLGLFAVFFAFPLNRLMPEEGFPLSLLAGGFLSWMIVLGSLAAWKDRTLLFVSLPGIAIFGLVGTFDTYTPGIWFFFVFLVCMGVLYARVHQRTMVQTAKLAGAEDPELLKRGAWKWMAGPEWALASGLAIVGLSLIGAPVVRQSVQGVSQGIRVNVPPPPRNQPQQPTPGTSQMGTESRIGQGPISPSENPALMVQGDSLNLLRVETFSAYTGSGWSNNYVSRIPAESPLAAQVSLRDDLPKGANGGLLPWANGTPPGEPILDPEILEVQVRPLVNIQSALPTPGPIVEIIPPQGDVRFFGMGQAISTTSLTPGMTYRYWAATQSRQPDERAKAVTFAEIESQHLSVGPITRQTRDLAFEIVQGLTSDIEKARAIEQWVARRAKYNLNAPATPRDVDPVHFFLFESQEGYCDLFASSFVVLARQAGLPARYATGWLVGDIPLDQLGWRTVRDKDYHAWAEVYFEGYGWVAFDPTQGAEQVPGSERGSSRRAAVFLWQNPYFFPVVLTLVLVGATFPILRSIFAHLRRAVDPAQRSRVLLLTAFSDLHLAVEKAAKSPKRFSQTIREYVSLHADELGPHQMPAQELVTRLESAMFSPNRLEFHEIQMLHKDVQAFRRELLEWVKMAKRAA